MPTLTPEAKKKLAETIRGTAQNPEAGIRARLLRAIHDEADRQYRLSIPIATAGLDESRRMRRERLEAWLDERARTTKAGSRAETKAAKDRFLAQAVKEAAATLVNRLVLLRLLEAAGLSRPKVVTGGWDSPGYRELRQFAPALCADATEGYATILSLVFDELALDLPGLFGDVGLTRLFTIPAAILRDVVESLDDPALQSAWTDDTTLGWVYQYWNDPERESLDAKINAGGKIEPHEIASKTQMFTERYMVEWLLQNSLGPTWLAMCRQHGWRADAERVLPELDARRADWRKKRDAGEVPLDALMPIDGELEDRWKYYVPPVEPVTPTRSPFAERGPEPELRVPESIRTLKILDPACGSGHFLVIAFDLLAALYREEARHRGETITDRAIAESILEHNLYGIDIDPRATQIAAAGLYLKAKALAKDARPKSVNLVAPSLQLGNLPADDPALVALRFDLRSEAGIPDEVTNRIVASLAGVDHLGTLLKVGAAVDDAIRSVGARPKGTGSQGDLERGFPAEQLKLGVGETKATVLDRLEQFLAKHSRAGDLGLRLDGEQLMSGVRFVRMAKEGTYDIVVGNPPYQGLSKTQSFGYVTMTYPRGKADLYAAFLERGLELAKPGGMSAMVTMQGWMFLAQFAELRDWLLRRNDLRAIADLMWCAFENMRHATVAMAVVARDVSPSASVALCPTERTEREESMPALRRKRAALLAQVGRYEFDPKGFEVIDGEPIVYWWTKEFLERYAAAPKLGDATAVRKGLITSDDVRFVRRWWEVSTRRGSLGIVSARRALPDHELGRDAGWHPLVKGAVGRSWFEGLSTVIRWRARGLEVKVLNEWLYTSYTRQVMNEGYYFQPGISFSAIGAAFAARAHRYLSVLGNMGSSVFPRNVDQTLCMMNSATSKFVLESINPGLHFEIGDVNRLPVFPIEEATTVTATLEGAFDMEEASREHSVEFRRPGPSAWRYAQDWAQRAVDRPDGAPLPPYEPTYDPPEPTAFISYAVGVALGRFGANGEGILEPCAPESAVPLSPSGERAGERGERSDVPLPSGILYLSAAATDSPDQSDSLAHPACAPLLAAWAEHGATVSPGDDLRTYLRKSFFDYHRKLYENRPIHFPLSSSKRSFVAFVSIHRWTDTTLTDLLADHLLPAKRHLEGEMDDLRTARASGTNKGRTEKRFTDVQKLVEELTDFIKNVGEIAERGVPQPDSRETDARFVMDLDDGVMVNSAALWPLLEAQWKDPKKWWKELAAAQGKKDYDWAHLAARYFPTRVRQKCHQDPSLAVAHHCFWELHPAKAYAWELRLQDEIRPDFTIDEPASDEARIRFLRDHDRQAVEIRAEEDKRRERKAKKAGLQAQGEFDLDDARPDGDDDRDSDDTDD